MANLVFDFLHNYHAGERRDSEPANAYQYDEGHVIEAVVPVVVTSCEIHYWIRGMEKAEAYAPDSITPNADGTCTILGHVPNEYFQTNGELRVYIVVTDGDASLTTYEGRIQVCQRSMPDDYVDDDPDNEATRVLNEAREAAATATAAAETAQDVADSIPADYTQLSDDVSSLKEDYDDIDDRVTALEGGGSGSGLTEDIKAAMLQIAQKVAYVDAQGQTYYDALYDALYPPADLVSISAVYTQSGTVYDTDSLNSLKSDLVVTAHMSDHTTRTVTTYTLSGTLAVGTSTITVTYSGKTTTFSVVVTHEETYITDGLFAYWDAKDNQATKVHNSSATTWVDKINGYTWTADKTDGTQWWSWDDDALVFAPASVGNNPSSGKNTFKCARPGTGLRTLEVVFTPDAVASCVGEFTSDNTSLTDGNEQIIGVLPSDNTFITKGVQNGYKATNITNIKSISATYDSSYAAVKAYMNGEEVTTKGSSHSFKYHFFSDMVLGAQNNSANLTYAFKGKIHAIRFYDRELTAEEIAENYALDVERFGLGGVNDEHI